VRAVVTVAKPREAGAVLEGRVENASIDGVRLRLPTALAEGSQVSVTLEGESTRLGSVRWNDPQDDSGVLHGIQFHSPPERRGHQPRLLRRLRLRRLWRRIMIGLIGLAAIAVSAYGIVWLLDSMRGYDPKFYEPKDVEREIYDLRRRMEEMKQPQKR
jgi:hypothetical protein